MFFLPHFAIRLIVVNVLQILALRILHNTTAANPAGTGKTAFTKAGHPLLELLIHSLLVGGGLVNLFLLEGGGSGLEFFNFIFNFSITLQSPSFW